MGNQQPVSRVRGVFRPVYLLIIFLLASNIYMATLISSKKNIATQENPYPLLDPARNFIPQKDFIVNIQPLREDLQKMAAPFGDSISLYFEFLNTGANISINPGVSIWPASLPKVPMAMAVMKKIEKGEWALDSELVLFEQDKDMKYGELWGRPVGTRFTIKELLEEILINSDNTAYRILLRNTDSNDLSAVIEELGLNDLFRADGAVSSKEYSRLFRSLYVSSFLERKNSEYILDLLSRSNFFDFLSAGLPPSVRFSHKFGIDRDKHAYLDSGIVYSPGRPYIITVAIGGKGTDGEAKRVALLMKEVSQKIYEYVVAK